MGCLVAIDPASEWPTRAKVGSKLLQVGPKLAQFGAKLTQMGTKLGRSWCQDGPQSSKLGPSWSQAGPSWPKLVPSSHQDGLRWPQVNPKLAKVNRKFGKLTPSGPQHCMKAVFRKTNKNQWKNNDFHVYCTPFGSKMACINIKLVTSWPKLAPN